MPTPETSTRQPRTPATTRWAVPGLALVIGAAYLVAGVLGDNTALAVGGPLLMVAVAAGFLLLARRSETVAGLRDRRDERINALDAMATTFAGVVVIVAVLVMFVVEVARGHSGEPYAALGALGGGAYLAALVWLRFRR
jgi:hypothetical protein